METANFVKGLNRARVTEEKMALALLPLCEPESLPPEVPAQDRERIRKLLDNIRDDTRRHMKILSDLLARWSPEKKS